LEDRASTNVLSEQSTLPIKFGGLVLKRGVVSETALSDLTSGENHRFPYQNIQKLEGYTPFSHTFFLYQH